MDDLTLDEALEELATAEEFLDYFGIPYERSVVEVNRLHILQRYHDYLANNAQPEDETARTRHYRDVACSRGHHLGEFLRQGH